MSYQDMQGFQFVGDLSMEDANILARLGKKSKYILEFGVGGSTQIFSQCFPDRFVAVETDPNWIDLTAKRLEMIENRKNPKFVSYGLCEKDQYDLIFVDGVDHLRREFAINTWTWLQVGGIMVFHDTRRFADFQNAMWVAQLNFSEVSRVDVNAENSNLTLIHKQKSLPYVNWNNTEDKPAWAYGNANIPEGEGLWRASVKEFASTQSARTKRSSLSGSAIRPRTPT